MKRTDGGASGDGTAPKKIKFTAKVEYSYEFGSNTWCFDSCHTSLNVVSDHSSTDSKKVLLPDFHKLLPKVLVERLHLCNKVDCCGQSYNLNPTTLTSYVTRAKAKPLVTLYNVVAHGVDVGAQKIYCDVHNIYRKFFRSMIDFVCLLHRHNLYIKSIDISLNFVVVEEELRYRNLSFGCGATSDLRKRDFEMLSVEIENLFLKKSIDVPPDLRHLLGLMKNYEPNDELLLVNHLSVLSNSERLAMIKNFATKTYYMSFSIWSKARRLDTNVTWSEDLDESKKPYFGPVIDCFKYIIKKQKQKEKEKEKKGDASEKKGEGPSEVGVGAAEKKRECPSDKGVAEKKQEDPSDKAGAISFIWFCRHLAEHLSDHIATHLRQSGTNRHPTVADSDSTIMAFYGLDLLDYQLQLQRKGILQYFLDYQPR